LQNEDTLELDDDQPADDVPQLHSALTDAEYRKVIGAADKAYGDIAKAAKTDFLRWEPVALGLWEMRLKAFGLSNSNDVLSKTYRDQFAAQIMPTKHLRNMDKDLRKALANIGQYWDELLAWWNDTLNDDQRAAWFSPQTVWRKYKEAGGSARRRKPPRKKLAKDEPDEAADAALASSESELDAAFTFSQAPLDAVRVNLDDYQATAAAIVKIVDAQAPTKVLRDAFLTGLANTLLATIDAEPAAAPVKAPRKSRGKAVQ
jgi:hypothetical protein